MFSWLQQAISPPSVQMGQPLSSESATKKKKVNDEGEMTTEEGFVCVGRSSFYSSPVEQPAVPFSYTPNNNAAGISSQTPFQNQNFPYPPNGGQPMYPYLPSPIVNANFQKQGETSSLEQVHDCLRHIPFVLHPDLRPVVGNNIPFSHNNAIMKKNMDWSQFDYDFDFERSVIREVLQHYSGPR